MRNHGSTIDLSVADTQLMNICLVLSRDTEKHAQEIEQIEQLLSKGANPNIKGPVGKRPLHGAAREGRKEIVRLLIAHGAHINEQTDVGNTPLELAIIEKRPVKFIEFLIEECRADYKKPMILATKEITLQRYAELDNQLELAKYLAEYENTW